MRYFRKSRQDFSCSVLTSITFIMRKFNRKIKDGRAGRLFTGFFIFTLLGIFACGGSSGSSGSNPTISWSLPTSATNEGGTPATITMTSNPAPTAELRVAMTLGGDATLMDDYTLTGLETDGASYTLIIPAGMTEASFTLIAVDDGMIENNETVVLTLMARDGYSLGTQNQHTTSVADDPFTISWTVATSAVAEGSSVTITLMSDRAPVVDLPPITIAIGGTAILISDYTLMGDSASPTLTIPAGMTEASFTLTAIDNNRFNEANKTVTLTLMAASGILLASPDMHTTTITDDDSPFIVLWNSGNAQGNFGFDRCQNILEASSGIGPALRDIGFTKAIFFGSTPVYNFTAIATDADALGMQTGTYTFANAATSLNVQVASLSDSMVSYTAMFGGSARTLGNLVGVNSNGDWQNGGQQIVTTAGITGITQFWSFTQNQVYYNDNCNGASTNVGATSGGIGDEDSVDGVPLVASATSIGCVSTTTRVLCLAR